MQRRKIQLIAGTTYTVSLPKAWVKTNHLKEKDELIIHEKDNKTLVLTPEASEIEELNELTLNIDEYLENIDEVLFAAYYLGVEEIELFSKQEISPANIKRIRKAITHMSGTEITYEDKNKIHVKVLLDKAKVDLIQTLYRIGLIIGSSLSNLIEKPDMDELKLNEDEIDRLYHLITKILSLSLNNPKVLQTSKVKNVTFIPSYLLISKRLEHIGDDLFHLANYLKKGNKKFVNKKQIFTFIKTELEKSLRGILKTTPIIFKKTPKDQRRAMLDTIDKIGDVTIENLLKNTIRFLNDIEEEIVYLSFYRQLISKGLL